jgi:GT2 family glycosyltransferase
MSPFAHFFFAYAPGGGYPTANIFYPRPLLERLGGFDAANFPGVAGEDTDLAARALAAGARARWAPEALVLHGVLRVGAIHRLRVAARWTPLVQVYKRHPGLRHELRLGLFWRENHWLLTRFLVALALPRRLGPIRLALAAPYVRHLTDRRTGPLLAPYLLAVDLVEVAAILRGAVRYRVPII